MPINFGEQSGASVHQPEQASQSHENTSQIGNVVLDLRKTVEPGLTLDLTKQAPILNNVLIGLGWDADCNEPTDLDLSAIMFRNKQFMSASDVVFYGNMSSNGFKLDKDNRNGQGDGDDEKIFGDLTQVPSDVSDIYLVSTIYDAVAKGQTFGRVKNSYIRIVDQNTNTELCNSILRDDFSTETGMIKGKLTRMNNHWEFKSIKVGIVGDLNDLIANIQNNKY